METKSTMLNGNGVTTWLHFALLDGTPGSVRRKTCIALSCFDRSMERIRGMYANLHYDNVTDGSRYGARLCHFDREPYKSDFVQIPRAYDKYNHMVAYSSHIGKTVDICRKDRVLDAFYSMCMNNTNLPLVKEWMGPLLEYAVNCGNAFVGHTVIGLVEGEREEDIILDLREHGGHTPLSEIEVIRFEATEEWILDSLQLLHRRGEIYVSKRPQHPINIKTMDGYLNQYGHSIVQNLRNIIHPLAPLSGEIDSLALKAMRLYPQQIAQVNGGVAALDKKNYVILNEGMGVGKTIQSISIVDARENRNWMRKHPGSTLKDCLNKDQVFYRTVVMCPGHLPRKWAKEIERNIPYAHVKVLETLEDVMALRELPRKADRKEFYVIGKDFCKLSYTYQPAPVLVKKRPILKQVCSECGKDKKEKGASTCSCGSKHFYKQWVGRTSRGMICPSCGELVMPFQSKMRWDDCDFSPLMPADFTDMKDSNSNCYYCGESLWAPCVSNLDTDSKNVTGVHKRPSKWYKMKRYTNAKKKATRNVWMLRDVSNRWEELYCHENKIESLGEATVSAGRKISPASFIKKYLKNFFEYAIFDEAHLYKGGGTAQGNAFASLVGASKKQLLLTGTIANGYANAIFYLLYRVDSGRMKQLGFEWTDEMKFVKTYGTLETQYAVDESSYTRNSSSKGRQLSAPKVKPGISPLLMLDLLFPVQLTLDLSDMSKFLPPLIEKVIPVEAEDDMLSAYCYAVRTMKTLSRKKEGKSVLGAMLQFALSYPDKPYGREPILSAIDGSILVQPGDCSHLISDGKLLNKERELVDLIRSEQAEGRNSVVYCEFTNSSETIITQRLKTVIEQEIPELAGKVAILESSSPKAIEREEWIHGKAREGVKVFITNPKCVETGLDFVWEETDIFGEVQKYNFPTLIFYQAGYNLYTLWQASRRHYRLCQKEECRTYYLAYKNTVQMDVLQILAEKQTATAAIQGKFSAEGLAAMAQQVDPRVRLAQSLCSADTVNVNELQNMFDVINTTNNSADENDEKMSSYEPMKLFSEIIEQAEVLEPIPLEIKVEKPESETTEFEFVPVQEFNFFSLFDTASASSSDPIIDSVWSFGPTEEKKAQEGTKRKKKKVRAELETTCNLLTMF